MDGLKCLTESDRQRVFELSTILSYSPGAVILSEGEVNDSLLILRDGRGRVEVGHLGGGVPIGFVEPGEVLGEISLLDGSAVSASIFAQDSVEVAKISGLALRSLIDADPGFGRRFYESLAIELAQRLRERTPLLMPPYSWG